jgi:hypothetical protein
MPGPLHDCYVLPPRRSADLAERFLAHFLPDREPMFAPEDPAEVLGLNGGSTVPEVLRFLEANPGLSYTMYWQNKKNASPFYAIVAFGSDGSLVLGLSPSFDDDRQGAIAVLADMKEFAVAEFAYAGVEEPPELSKLAFVARSQRAD